jgi:hypothetical protein
VSRLTRSIFLSRDIDKNTQNRVYRSSEEHRRNDDEEVLYDEVGYFVRVLAC